MAHADHRTQILRSTATVAFPTLVSRALGYVRDLLQALFLGTGHAADAFIIAFTIPNLLRRLTAEGAMSAAFVPTFAAMKKEEGDGEANRFASVFFADLALVMAVAAVLGVAFAPGIVRVIAFGFEAVPGKWELAVGLTRIMFPFIAFVSLSALAGGILNTCGRFFVPASTSVLFNLAVIASAVVFARGASEPAAVFAAGVVAGGGLQLLFQIPFLRREGLRFSFRVSFAHPGVRKVAALMGPGILGASAYQINFAVSRMIASGLEKGSASALYYSSRVEELTLGLFTVALSVVLLPAFSAQAASRDTREMKKTLDFSLRLVALVTIPAAAGLAVLHRPIIRVLFERGAFDSESTAMSSLCLVFFALGLPFVSGVKIVAPVFFSLKDTRTPVVVGTGVLVLNIVLSLVLMGPLRVGGLALSLSIAQALNFVVLFVWMERKIGPMKKDRAVATGIKALAASLLMAGALSLAGPLVDDPGAPFVRQVAVLLGAIVLGIAIYGLVLRILGPQETRALAGLLLKPREKPGERSGEESK
jgi:putative peptidoglycan lipid II flippase